MALPTGTISMSDVNVELGRPWNATISLGDAEVRSLAGRPSGAISMADLRGKSSMSTVYARQHQSGNNQYRGFMRPNDYYGFTFGDITSQSFGGGTITGFYTITGANTTKMFIRDIDLGHNVTVQVNGVNYGFTRSGLSGVTHYYECFDGNLFNFVTDAGIKGWSFTIKKV